VYVIDIGMLPYWNTTVSESELSAMLYVPESDVPVMFFSAPSTFTFVLKVWSANVTTWFSPNVNLAPLMVNDGIVFIPFMAGRVMLPDSMPFIANNIVSLGLSLLIVETFIFEAPTNFIGPCICAMIVVAVNAANKRVKILFIKRVVIIFDF
jgi:hypothetical protein